MTLRSGPGAPRRGDGPGRAVAAGWIAVLLATLSAGAVLLAGCGSTAVLPAGGEGPIPSSLVNSVVFIVHGDGDYLYHEQGRARRADAEAVARAREMAAVAAHTEVLIFHQRRRRGALRILPLGDGTFYHYRGGKLLASQRYRRDPVGHGLNSEVRLYRDHALRQPESRALLFFGHTIEDGGGDRYHASYPGASFGLAELTDALAGFGAGEHPLDLLVLSTCSNGTPATISALSPLARRIIASPGRLHLSHIDPRPLAEAGENGIDGDLAARLAEAAFTRLAGTIRTAVTIALYDSDLVAPLLPDLLPAIADERARTSGRQAALLEMLDCREVLAGIDRDRWSKGVRHWYRPPAFGRRSTIREHSGWGCLPPDTTAG
jgi:hypothetical protein